MDAIYLGQTPALRAYKGREVVWEAETSTPAEIAFVQEWLLVNGSSTISGANPTTDGSLLVAVCGIRDNTVTDFAISDSAGNTWTEAFRYVSPNTSAAQFLFYVSDAKSITNATFSSNGTGSIGAVLMEFSGAGGLVEAVGGSGGNEVTTAPFPVNASAGDLVIGGLTGAVTNRTWEPTDGNYVGTSEFRGGQMTVQAQWDVRDSSGSTSPQWNRTSGTASSTGIIVGRFGAKPQTVPTTPPVEPSLVLDTGPGQGWTSTFNAVTHDTEMYVEGTGSLWSPSERRGSFSNRVAQRDVPGGPTLPAGARIRLNVRATDWTQWERIYLSMWTPDWSRYVNYDIFSTDPDFPSALRLPQPVDTWIEVELSPDHISRDNRNDGEPLRYFEVVFRSDASRPGGTALPGEGAWVNHIEFYEN